MVVALVSRDPQKDLVRYFRDAGFDIRPVKTPDEADEDAVLLWLTDVTVNVKTVEESLWTWLDAREAARAIVVTDRPTAFRSLVDRADGRVSVLAAPVFAWDLVDALRGPPP